MINKRNLLLSIKFLLLSSLTTTFAQEKAEKWDVNKPQRETSKINFTTDEGTWLNLDVSPDGKSIVFDLLGDIYSMPITGGKATLLRGGLAWEVQPKYSPNGKYIAFTSDAGGGDNIWYMKTDGSDPKKITSEKFRLLNNPTWTEDSQYLVARKHYTFTRSLGAGALWMYHISGGEGIELVKRKNEQQDINEPSVSNDGRYIYFSEDVYPGGFFQYNKDPNNQIYVIKSYDRQSGEIKTVVSGPGGAIGPKPSHDGKKLSFIRRVRTKSVLYIHDFENNTQTPLFDQLEKDQQEAWAIFGPSTKYAWTPDDKHIIIWGKGGKIWKVNTTTGKGEIVPFSVDVDQEVSKSLRFKHEVAPDKFTAKAIRNVVTSKDGKTIYFHAAGYLYSKKLPNGKPKRLTTQNIAFEYEPSLSLDGNKLVYTSWSDQEKGKIHVINLNDNSTSTLALPKGIYRRPQFSPDNKSLVFVKEAGNNQQGYAFTKNPGLYTVAISDLSTLKRIVESGDFPKFNTKGDRVYYQTGGFFFGSLKKAFKSVNLNGEDVKVHFTTKYTNQFVPSPDNKWIAFTELFKVYIAPMPKTGKPIDLSSSTKAIPVAQVAKDAGYNIHWSNDNTQLHWSLGNEYFSTDLKDVFSFIEGAPKDLPDMKTEGIKINLELTSAKPTTVYALTNARIITVDQQNKVIENGTIIIKENRIQAIGNDIKIPSGAKVIDCQNKTIMPGIVDAHAHLGAFRLGLSAKQNWPYFTNLAYGVTTTHDPSANSEMVFNQSEMVKTGAMVGPRIYSTGVILYGADGDFKANINSLDDARSAIRRTKAWGAISVKSYNQPRREQRQQVIKAAEEEEIMVVPEGGSTFYHNMSMIVDGHTGIEHNIPVTPVFNDVQNLWAKTEVGYTPTLIVNYGGINGEYYWYQHTNVWEKERLLKFTPRAIIDSRSRHRTMVPEKEYEIGHIATSKSAKMLSDKGVKVNLGAHGQIQGIGAHWELWMLAQGGMSPMEAIRSATYNGAHYLGLDDDIGSLEKGKLADLIILEKNPLEDIYNSESIEKVMINGVLYDAENMDQIDGEKRKKFYWEEDGYNESFEWHEQTNGFTIPKCGCSLH
ncbi:amidohydrolase family protein [Flammeovirga kamogawensis]|uniref:PD40 domain-containing protein n=1 Tax=Flammeovirga kamogawensis TaxID=373891 RepID=A0ABX8GYC0_9BACT|nr:amidohydrolase family protein [Flammeovirga kamogawensis]MBB6460566.1 imidazolonepropionase-like amidohydrolase/Tol biopolymer transport system component [Flammeovirga kamogawensis]QWG07925.1 PD40 domain-containing protein [Flammeovirga kamogawensis]TRX69732.1 amidohydrolase family protein [Flammeovirga kamogawensis]